jgi:hypothetical protein
MTRNREIDCEDLFGCDHALTIPISQDGEWGGMTSKAWVAELNEATAILRLVDQAMRDQLYSRHGGGTYTCPGCGSWCFIGEVNHHVEPPSVPEGRGCRWGEIQRRLAALFRDEKAGMART